MVVVRTIVGRECAIAVAMHPIPSSTDPTIIGRFLPSRSASRPAGRFNTTRAHAGTATRRPTEDS